MTGPFTIERIAAADLDGWTAMRRVLFPTIDDTENWSEARAWLARPGCAVYGARSAKGWVGFIEVGPRDVGQGCETSPVGYIEALWVDTALRRQGIARALVEAAKAWTLAQGWSELASDVEIENLVSQTTHEHLGFEETQRLVTYRMDLRTKA